MTFNWQFFQKPADAVLLPLTKQRPKLERVPTRRQTAPLARHERRGGGFTQNGPPKGWFCVNPPPRWEGAPRGGLHAQEKGRRPIAPPRLVCTLESPVSLRIDGGQLGIHPGPASSVPVISPFRNTFRRTLASALAPDVIGPRSHGRRAQTARSLRCSLDSPPYDGRWFVATVPLLTHLVPAQAGFTRSYQSRPQAGCFCRQTV